MARQILFLPSRRSGKNRCWSCSLPYLSNGGIPNATPVVSEPNGPASPHRAIYHLSSAMFHNTYNVWIRIPHRYRWPYGCSPNPLPWQLRECYAPPISSATVQVEERACLGWAYWPLQSFERPQEARSLAVPNPKHGESNFPRWKYGTPFAMLNGNGSMKEREGLLGTKALRKEEAEPWFLLRCRDVVVNSENCNRAPEDRGRGELGKRAEPSLLPRLIPGGVKTKGRPYSR